MLNRIEKKNFHAKTQRGKTILASLRLCVKPLSLFIVLHQRYG